MLNTVCTALAGAGISCTTQDVEGGVQSRFMDHVANFNINYGTQEEYAFRMEIFAAKDAEYNKINNDPENTFVVGHNMFSTMTTDEAKRMMGRLPNTANLEVESFDESLTADSVDWRLKGAVNPVQNQGQCGSCWAFSSTAAMEGAHFIKTGTLLKLAEQQLVDCDKQDSGCNGGLEAQAFIYATSNGMELESAYPYTAKTGKHCNAKKFKGQVKATSHAAVQHNSVDALKAAITAGPTCVAVDAANNYFQGYTSGVLNNCGKGSNLDHAITAVGYGKKNGVTYAIVRNSWTASWGEAGYIRMALTVQGSQGACGILMDPTTVKTD